MSTISRRAEASDGSAIEKELARAGMLSGARELLLEIYKHHSVAQSVLKESGYRYHQYYRYIVSAFSALSGAAGGVGIQQFTDIGWGAVPIGTILGVLVTWAQQQIESSAWRKRVGRSDTLAQLADAAVDAIPATLDKGEPKIEEVVKELGNQASSTRHAFHLLVNVKQEVADLINEPSITRIASKRLANLEGGGYGWLRVASAADVSQLPEGLVIRQPPAIRTQQLTGAA